MRNVSPPPALENSYRPLEPARRGGGESSATGALSIAGEAPRGNELLAAGRLVPPQTAGELVGDEVDLATMGAIGDAYSFPDGTMAAGSNSLSSQSATFLSTDVGKYRNLFADWRTYMRGYRRNADRVERHRCQRRTAVPTPGETGIGDT